VRTARPVLAVRAAGDLAVIPGGLDLVAASTVSLNGLAAAQTADLLGRRARDTEDYCAQAAPRADPGQERLQHLASPTGAGQRDHGPAT
jgi:hypothetical protein